MYFDVASNLIWWEDFKVGERAELGRHTFSEKAKTSIFGSLIASGWHTCAVGMRLMCEGYLNKTASPGSPGIDNWGW